MKKYIFLLSPYRLTTPKKIICAPITRSTHKQYTKEKEKQGKEMPPRLLLFYNTAYYQYAYRYCNIRHQHTASFFSLFFHLFPPL